MRKFSLIVILSILTFSGFKSSAQTVMSITRADSDTTNAEEVNFTVVFASATTGVDITNFQETFSGTTGIVGVPTSVDDITWNVLVGSITGDGSLGINFVSNSEMPVTTPFTGGDTYTIDNTAPTVSSINRVSPNALTNAASLDFTVTFSEVVTGVTTANFMVTGTATGTVAVTGTGNIYTVIVSAISGAGDIGLDFTGSVADLAGNTSSVSSIIGQSYTMIDRVAPTVTSINRVSAYVPTNAASLDFTVMFSEAVTGVDVANFMVTGTATGTVATVTVTGTGDVYTVTVNTISGEGDIGLDFTGSVSVVDLAGNTSSVGFTGGDTYTIDNTSPVSSITRVGADVPTNVASLDFTVTFSEVVTGVDVANFMVTGTATGTVAAVTGTGNIYTVTVNTISGAGDIGLDFTGSVVDMAGNTSSGSFTGGDTYTIDNTAPIVDSINRASPNELTNAASLDFTVIFSEVVTGVITADFAVTGTATGTVAIVTDTGTGDAYTVTVSAISGEGDIRLDFTGSVEDLAGNTSSGSFIIGQSYTIDNTAPTVSSINRVSPNALTNATSLDFTVTFSEAVTGVDVANFMVTGMVTGTATGTVATVIGTGNIYTVTVSAISGEGDIGLDFTGSVEDLASNTRSVGFTGGDTYTIDNTAPTVSSINRVGAYVPTNAASLDFTVMFSEAVTGVDVANFMVTGTATGTVATVTGTGNIYTVTVNTISGEGDIGLDFTGSVVDLAGNTSSGSFTGGDTYTIDNTSPVSSITRVSPDVPTNAASLDFTVTFSEVVTGVDVANFMVTGTATGTVAAVTGTGNIYTVTVNTISGAGDIGLDFTGSVVDMAGNTSSGSFTGGDTYTIDNTAPTVDSITRVGADVPTNAASLDFTVMFSEAVTNVDVANFMVTGTATGTVATVTDTGTGNIYTVTVNTISGEGDIGLDFTGSVSVVDLAGNTSSVGFTGGDTYTIDNTAPTVSSITRVSPNALTNATSLDFTVTFSEAVTGVDVANFMVTGMVTGTATGTVATVIGTGNIYTVTVSAISGEGDIGLDFTGSVEDLASNTGSVGFTGGDTYTIDNTAPTVSSINRVGADVPTNAASLDFTVTFSEAVTGVDVANFMVTGTATGTVATVTDTGTGDIYTVTVSAISGAGDIGLDFTGSVEDLASNTGSVGFTGGDTYTIDNTAPTVSSINRVSPDVPTNATNLSFTVTFSGTVTNVDIADFIVTGTATGTATGTVAAVTGTGNIYTVTVNTISGEGDIRLDFTGSVVDLAGNTSSGSFIIGQSYTIDNKAPTVDSINRASPNELTNAASLDFTVIFSEVVTGVITADFAVTGTATGTVAAVTGTGDAYTVTVNTISGEGDIRLDFTGSVEDLASNTGSGNFLGRRYTMIDRVAPTVTSINRVSLDVPTNAASLSFTVTFSEVVTGVTTADFTVTGTATGTVATVTDTGTGDVYTVTVNTISGAGDIGLDFTGSVEDLASNTGSVDFNGSQSYTMIDRVAPTFVNATLFDDNENGSIDRILFEFSKNINEMTLLASDFNIGGDVVSFISVNEVSGDNQFVTVDVDILNRTGDQTIVYTQGTLADILGNLATSNNSITTIDMASPVLLDARINDTNSDGFIDQVVYTFSEIVSDADDNDIYAPGDAGSITLPDGQTAVYTGDNISVTNDGIQGYVTISNITGQNDENTAIGVFDVTGVDDRWDDNQGLTSIGDGSEGHTDGAAPVLLMAETVDNNNNGQLDALKLTFSETVDQSDISSGHFTVDGYTIVGANTDTGNDSNIIIITLTESGMPDTYVTPDLSINGDMISDISPSNNMIAMVAGIVAIDRISPYISVDILEGNSSPDLSGTVDDRNATLIITIGGYARSATNNGDGTWTLANSSEPFTLSRLGVYEVTVVGIDNSANIGLDITSNEYTVEGGANVTPATQGAICVSDSYTPLGEIVISETAVTGFLLSGTIVLALPDGFIFNTGIPINFDGSSLTDIDVSGMFSGTSSLTLTIDHNAAIHSGLDILRINGLQVQATLVGQTDVVMKRIGGTATLLTTDTDYAILSSQSAPAMINSLDETTSGNEDITSLNTRYGSPFTLDATDQGPTNVDFYESIIDDNPEYSTGSPFTVEHTDLKDDLGLHTYYVISRDECNSDALEFKLLIYSDDNPATPGEIEQTFGDREFLLSDDVYTFYLSNPSDHTVNVFGNGISVVDPDASTLQVSFNPKVANVGVDGISPRSHPITYRVTNDMTGSSASAIVQFTVEPGNEIFVGHSGIEEFAADAGVIILEMDTTAFRPYGGGMGLPYIDGMRLRGLRNYIYDIASSFPDPFGSYDGGQLETGISILGGVVVDRYQYAWNPSDWSSERDIERGDFQSIEFIREIKPTRDDAVNYFIVYGIPILELQNVDAQYCSDDVSFTLMRRLIYVESVDTSNPSNPVGTYNTDTIEVIENGYELYRSDDGGIGTYELYADFTGTSIRTFDPRDPNQNGVVNEAEDIGFFRIKYTADPLTRVNIVAVDSVEMTIISDPPAPELTSATINGGGAKRLIDYDITRVVGRTVDVREYLLEYCVGDDAPFFETASPGEINWYDDNFNLLVGNSDMISAEEVRLSVSGGKLATGQEITFYFTSRISYGCESNYRRVVVIVHDIPKPVKVFDSEEGRDGVLYQIVCDGGGDSSFSPPNIAIDVTGFDGSSSMHTVEQLYHYNDALSPYNREGYVYEFDVSGVSTTHSYGDSVSVPHTRGMASGFVYSLYDHQTKIALVLDSSTYTFNRGAIISNIKSRGMAIVDTGFSQKNVSFTIIPPPTLTVSLPLDSVAYYRYTLSRTENIRLTDSTDFPGCKGSSINYYYTVYPLPTDVNEMDLNDGTLEFHVSEGESMRNIGHEMSEGTDEYRWQEKDGFFAPAVIEILPNGGSMSQNILASPKMNDLKRLNVSGGLVQDRGNDGVNDLYTYYLSRISNKNDNDIEEFKDKGITFSGCQSRNFTPLTITVHAKKSVPTVTFPSHIDFNNDLDVTNNDGSVIHYFSMCSDELSDADGRVVASDLTFTGAREFKWYSANAGGVREGELSTVVSDSASFLELQLSGLRPSATIQRYFIVTQVTDNDVYEGVESDGTLVRVDISPPDNLAIMDDMGNAIADSYCRGSGLGNIVLDLRIQGIGGTSDPAINKGMVTHEINSYLIELDGTEQLAIDGVAGQPDNPTLDFEMLHDAVPGSQVLGGLSTVHEIIYTFFNSTTLCEVVNTVKIIIHPDPDISISYNDMNMDGLEFCYDDSDIELVGLTLSSSGDYVPSNGGNFKLNGATISTTRGVAAINPSAIHGNPFVARSSHSIDYRYIDGNGCERNVRNTIYINPRPEISGGAINIENSCISDNTELFVEIFGDMESNYTYLWMIDGDTIDNSTENRTDVGGNPSDEVLVYSLDDRSSANFSVHVTNRITGCVARVLNQGVVLGEESYPSVTWVGMTANHPMGTNFRITEDNIKLPDDDVNYVSLSINGTQIYESKFPVFPINVLYNSSIPGYAFTRAGLYEVSVGMETIANCEAVLLRRDLQIVEHISIGSVYRESFESGAGGWIIDSLTSDGKSSDRSLTSWEIGTNVSDFTEDNSTYDGFTAVYTNNYKNGEVSFLYSPSFDLSGFDSPAIRFLRYEDFESFRDGVVFQMSIDDGRTWKNVGSYNDDKPEGLKSTPGWYNRDGITSSPGNTSPGPLSTAKNSEGLGWALNSDWTDTAIPIPIEAGQVEYVRFRFALAAQLTRKSTKGFAFDLFEIYNRERVVLVEQFSSALSQESVEINKIIDTNPSFNDNDVVKINYFTDFANNDLVGNDLLNQRYTSGPGAKSAFYGIADIPGIVISGGTASIVRNNSELENFVSPLLDNAKVINPGFSISINASIDTDNKLTVEADFLSTKEITNAETNLGMFIAVLEPEIIVDDNMATAFLNSGDTVRNVLRTIFPDPSGHIHKGVIARGEVLSIPQETWPISNMFNKDTLVVVAYIQDLTTRIVYQSSSFGLKNNGVLALGLEESEEFSLYPNPTDKEVMLEFSKQLTQDMKWTIYDQVGKKIVGGELSKGTKTTTIQTSEITLGMYFIYIYAEDLKKYMKRAIIIQH